MCDAAEERDAQLQSGAEPEKSSAAGSSPWGVTLAATPTTNTSLLSTVIDDAAGRSAGKKSSDGFLAAVQNLSSRQHEADTGPPNISEREAELRGVTRSTTDKSKSVANDKVVSSKRQISNGQSSKQQSSNDNIRRNQCEKCGKAFKHSSGLEYHTRTHTGERPYQCLHCSESFAQPCTLKRHLLTHTGDRPFKCYRCPRAFRRCHSLKVHSLTHAESLSGAESKERGPVLLPFHCADCDESFARAKQLVAHQRVHSGVRLHQCTECDRSFSKKRDKERHVSVVHAGERPHKCSQCGKTFGWKSTLVVHQQKRRCQTQPSKKPAGEDLQVVRPVRPRRKRDVNYVTTKQSPVETSTEKKNESLASAPNLLCHQLMPGPRPVGIPQDNAEALIDARNAGHTAVHVHTSVDKNAGHGGARSLQCRQCSESFATESDLTMHQRVHSGGRSFQCTECSMFFLRRSMFVIHQRMHTGERPFQCTECGSSFRGNSALRQHQRVHAGVRPYKCGECDSTFAQKSHLTQHKRVHTGERLYRCAKCDKSFSTKQSQEHHERVVCGGERPFQCQRCCKTFGHKGSLEEHYQKRVCQNGSRVPVSHPCHPENIKHRYAITACKHCPKMFRDRQSVTEHVLAVHVPIESQFGCGRCTRSFEFAHEAMACFNKHDRFDIFRNSMDHDALAMNVPVEARFGCGRCAGSFEFAHEAKVCFVGHKSTV